MNGNSIPFETPWRNMHVLHVYRRLNSPLLINLILPCYEGMKKAGNSSRSTPRETELGWLDKIQHALDEAKDILFETSREKHVQNILKAQLDCQKRHKISSKRYPDAEVDLYGDDFIIETKFHKPYYAGVGQIMMFRKLYGLENCALIHVCDFVREEQVRAFKDLASKLGFPCFLIDQRMKRIVSNKEVKDR